MSTDDGQQNETAVTITVYPDGPLLVRGPARIETPDGHEVVNPRATRALCRCGKSSRKPWCDGNHKTARAAKETLR